VSDEHNYFVAGDVDSPAVLVHNTTTLWSCTTAAARLLKNTPAADRAALETALRSIDEGISDATRINLGELFTKLTPDEGDFLLGIFATSVEQSGAAVAAKLAERASRHSEITSLIVNRGGGRSAGFVGLLLADDAFDAIDSANEINVVVERLSLGSGSGGWADEPAEQFVAEVLEARDLVVERRPFESVFGAGPQGDAWVVSGSDVVIVDFKEYFGDSLKSLSSTIRKSAAQTREPIIDFRRSPMSEEVLVEAMQDILRQSRAKFDEIEVFGVGPDNDLRVVWSSGPQGEVPADTIVIYQVGEDSDLAATFVGGSVLRTAPSVRPEVAE